MAVAGTLEIQMLASVARLSSDMNQAKTVVGSAMKNIESAVASAKSALGALGIGLGAGVFVSFIEGGIKAEDQLHRLNLQTGITVETLSALRPVATEAGTDLDTAAGMVNKLEKNMLTFAQNGGGKAADAFAQLGLSQAQVQAGLQNMDEFLPQFAKKLLDAGVGGETAGLAMQLMAKGGAAALPFLEQLVATGTLHAKVSTDQAIAAHEFEVNLAKLKEGQKELAISLANELIPAMTRTTTAMIEAKKEGGLLLSMWIGFGGVMAPLGVLWKGFNNTLDEANISFLKFLHIGVTDGSIATLEAAIVRRNNDILALTGSLNDGAAQEHKNNNQGLEDLAAKRAAEKAAVKAAQDAAKELQSLRDIDTKNMLAGIDVETAGWDQFYKDSAALAQKNNDFSEKMRQEDLKGWVAHAEAVVQQNFDEARQLADVQIAEVAKVAEESKKIVDQIDHDTHSTFVKMFDKLGGGWKGFLESMAASFKKLVADQIYMFFARPFVLSVIANVAGMTGMSGVADAARSASGIASAATTASSSGALGGMFNIAAPAWYTAGIADGTITAAGTTGVAAGMAADVTAGAGATTGAAAGAEAGAAGGAMSGVATVVPWVAAAVAAYYLLHDSGGPAVATGTGVAGTVSRGGFTGQLSGLSQDSGNQYSDPYLVPGGPAYLQDAMSKAATDAFAKMTDLAQKMGLSADALNSMKLPVSFQVGADSLSEDPAVRAAAMVQGLNTAIGSMTDQMALTLMPNIKDFAQGNETLTQTFDRLAGAQVAVTAAAVAADDALAKVRQGWQDQLDVLTGARTQTQVERTNQLAEVTDAATIAIMNQVYAAQDQATANAAAAQAQQAATAAAQQAAQDAAAAAQQAATLAAERRALEIRLMTAQGDTAGALAAQRALEMAAASDLNKVLLTQIYAADDLTTATAAATKATQDAAAAQNAVEQAHEASVTSAVGSLQQAYQRESADLTAMIGKWEAAGTSLRAYSATLTGMGGAGSSYSSASSQFNATAASARLGDLTAIGNLQSVSETFRAASLATSATQTDYLRDIGRIQAAIADTVGVTDRQGSVAQQQLDGMRTQVSSLVDINSSVISVKEAIADLKSELASLRASSDKTAASTAAQESFWRRISPDGQSLKTVAA